MMEWVASVSQKLAPLLKGSPLAAFGVAFVGGVLLSLTPCVYPVIPIIVGFVGGAGERSRFRAFLLSLFYALGMAVTFAALGAVVGLLGKGFWRPHPAAYVIAGGFILLFGLSLLGVFTIPVPGFLRRGPTNPRQGLLGAALMGLASSLVTVPCTTAVLSGVLAIAANKQSVLFGFLLLLSFALGLGVLLVLVGTFTGVLVALPKPGRWMQFVEKAFGVGMIILSFYFFALAAATPWRRAPAGGGTERSRPVQTQPPGRGQVGSVCPQPRRFAGQEGGGVDAAVRGIGTIAGAARGDRAWCLRVLQDESFRMNPFRSRQARRVVWERAGIVPEGRLTKGG